jgi:two-component system NarL family response regulator
MPRSKRIRVVLADDHPIVREGLRSILSGYEQIDIAGEAGSGREAIEVSKKLKPDVVLMDIAMADIGGIEATAILGRDLPDCKVLALSMHENSSYVRQALNAGARGYMLKDSGPDQLAHAIGEVMRGEIAISPQAANSFIGNAFHRRGEPTLTGREIDVLRFIARGLTNKEISVQLDLSVRTVESHRENLIRKTGRSTVAELTRYAVTQGYGEPDSRK